MFFFILIFISGNVGHLERSTYMTGVREDLIENDIKTAIDVECIPGDVVLFSNILIHRGGVLILLTRYDGVLIGDFKMQEKVHFVLRMVIL